MRTDPALPPRTVQLVANGDLRLSANRKCWPEQAKMEAALGRALKAEGWKVRRGHPVDKARGHGFIDSQKVGLEVFRVNPEHAFEDADGIGVLAYEEQHATHLVGHDAVFGVLRFGLAQVVKRGIIVAVGLIHHGLEEVGAGKLRPQLQGPGEHRLGSFGLPFLDEGASYV